MSKHAVIIIPTYNEAKSIGNTLVALQQVLSQTVHNWTFDVLIVDDSSPDGTGQVIKELQRKYAFLHLLTNPKKSGLGGAYLKGMTQAFDEMHADVVFEFDADLSHDPQRIPDFIKKIDDGADMVLGSRYIDGGSIPDNWGIHRKFLSVFGNIFISLILTDFSIKDWTTGYRAITTKVYKAVEPEMHAERFSGYTFQIGFLHKTIRKGFKVAEVPIHFVDRTEGESKLGTEYIKNTLMYILRVRLKEITQMRAFKFLSVGVIGAVVQLGSLHFFRYILPVSHVPFLSAFQEATLLSIEAAIISNFIWSNLWTFSDRRLPMIKLPAKFLQFNVTSLGSLVIQFVINSLGERMIGLFVLFTLPVIGFSFDTGFFFAIAGIVTGMFWNFFAYSKIIWRKKK